MFGRLNGRNGRRNDHATVELAPRVRPIVTITSAPGGAGRSLADAVAGVLEMRVLDLDAGSEQLTGPIKETLTYLWDHPDLLKALLGSLGASPEGSGTRPARDILFDLASRSGMVVVGGRAGAMLRHRRDAFHVRVDAPRAGRPAGADDPVYQLLLDLELLPMETCIDLIVAASRSHARRVLVRPLANGVPATAPAPRPRAPRAAQESPDVVMERLARALQTEVTRE